MKENKNEKYNHILKNTQFGGGGGRTVKKIKQKEKQIKK